MRSVWQALSLLLLSSHAHCDPCPKGYTQAPNGGDCYQIKVWYSTFIGQYYPSKSFDEVEYDCNLDGTTEIGGMLASIHSAEENEFMKTVAAAAETTPDGGGLCLGVTNIGLRCTGRDCKWDDGSPVTYTSFDGEGPPDDKKTRCYGMNYKWNNEPLTWKPKDCGTYPADCWMCSVKAKSIECEDGEFEYKGGCVSVHKTPLDHQSAEASCQEEGGHLISVHSNYEAYVTFAKTAKVHGTVHIGGQFSNGKFEWLDGSYPSYTEWATGFPNTIFGACVQMLVDSELGYHGQWTNVECSTKQAYMCFRNGREDYGEITVLPQPPKADAQCPPIQYYTGSGTIYSPNYPLSIPSQQKCEYIIGTEEGTFASLAFETFNCTSGTSVYFYDGLNSDRPIFTFHNRSPSVNMWYPSMSNVLKMVYTVSASEGTGWEAKFTGLP